MMLIITSTWKAGKIRMTGLYLLLILLPGVNLYAQQEDPYGFRDLKTLFSVSEHSVPKYVSDHDRQKNEFEFLLSIAFNFYKAYFSSQDAPSCVFHPSCSEYSIRAFQQKGFFLGTLYTFDRLSRCHSLFNSNEYYLDPETYRYHDPLE